MSSYPNVDSYIDKEVVRVQHRITRYDIDWAANYAQYQDEIVDTDDLPSDGSVSSISYETYILNSVPSLYYRLGENTATTTAVDASGNSNDGTYDQNANYVWGDGHVFLIGGALFTDTDEAHQFDPGHGKLTRTNIGGLGTAGVHSAFSAEWWQKPNVTGSRDVDGVWMLKNNDNSTFIHVYYQNGTINVSIKSDIATKGFWVPYTMTGGSWYHIAITITADEALVIYINGVPQVSNGSYFNGINSAASTLSIGLVDGGSAIPAVGIDEFALFPKALSASEVFEHYTKGITNQSTYSQFYQLSTPTTAGTNTVTLVAPLPAVDPTLVPGQYVNLTDASDTNPEKLVVSTYDGTTGIMVFTTNIVNNSQTELAFFIPVQLMRSNVFTDSRVLSTLPTLTGAQDITGYIERYQISKDAHNLVSVVTLDIHDKWASTTLDSYLDAGTYITIEQRKLTSYGDDTGWYNVGAFLIDAPVRSQETGQGERLLRTSGKGVLKLITLDLVNYPLQPDIIKVTRRQATETYSDAFVTIWRMPRVGTSSPVQYYYNWSTQPNVRIWATNFLNTLNNDTDILLSDTLPIKASNGSIQIVGGTGEVIFNTNKFNAKVKDSGFGEPANIELEFYRYATVEDIILAPLAATPYTMTYTPAGAPLTAVLTLSNASSQFFSSEYYEGRSVIAKSGTSAGTIFKVVAVSIVGSDVNLSVKTIDSLIPDLAQFTFATGDVIQVTDANLIQDAISKILLRKGFQTRDSSKPFYINIQPPNTIIQIPPLNYTYTSSISDDKLMQEVMSYGPPNYYLFEAPDGSVTTRTVIQDPIGTWDHDLTNTVFSFSNDSSDFGVFDRVISQGNGVGNYNVCLGIASGGPCLAGAYQLSGWYGHGSPLSQSAADGYWQQVFDTDPTTPQVYGSVPFNYGVLLDENNSATHTWTFTDTVMGWFDIGRNPNTGNPWLIDQMVFTSFQSFVNGNVIKQSLFVDYMTEADFILRTGYAPPLNPSDDVAGIKTAMLTIPTSPGWLPFIDETLTDEGDTTVTSDAFLTRLGDIPRFFRVRVGQPWFRYQDSNHTTGEARFILSSIQATLSRNIVQSAELGVDQGFNDSGSIALQKRLRRRTVVLDPNPALGTSVQAKTFALNQLRELYSEFTPNQCDLALSNIDLHETARYVNPFTGVEGNYIIRAIQINSDVQGNDSRTVTMIDYSTFVN